MIATLLLILFTREINPVLPWLLIQGGAARGEQSAGGLAQNTI